MPAKVCGSISNSPCSISTPAFDHLVTMLRCHSSSNHSTTDSAMIAPTPSTSANSSTVAFEIFSTDPKRVANACAAVGPTCRMESATITRHKGRLFASSSAVTKRSAIAESDPSFLVKKVERSKSWSVSANISLSSSTKPSTSNACAAS